MSYGAIQALTGVVGSAFRRDADEMQGRGLATVLLAHLAQVASARGITTFTATVLPENRRMISVFRESGFPVEVHSSPDAIELEFPTGTYEPLQLPCFS